MGPFDYLMLGVVIPPEAWSGAPHWATDDLCNVFKSMSRPASLKSKDSPVRNLTYSSICASWSYTQRMK